MYLYGGNRYGAYTGSGTDTSFHAASTIWLGGYQTSPAYAWSGTIYALAAWPQKLTQAQSIQAYQNISAILMKYGVNVADTTDYSRGAVAFDGDSITETSSGGAEYRYTNGIAALAMDSLGKDLIYYNVGHSGADTAGLVGEFQTKTLPLLQRHGSPRGVVLASGTNDISARSEDNGTILANYAAYCGEVNTEASGKCALTTVLPTTRLDCCPPNIEAGFESQRLALNASIISGILDGSLGAVSLSDWGSDPIMGNLNTVNNQTYYRDTLHPAPAGASILSRYHALAEHRMMSPKEPYWIPVGINTVALAGIDSQTDAMKILQMLPGEQVCGVTARVDVPFTGGGATAATVTVGDSTGSTTQYTSSLSLLATGATTSSGSSFATVNGVVTANLAAAGGNLSSFTAGNLTVSVCVVKPN